MAKFFISYRREDSKHAVGRLYAALKRHVRDPKRDIFIDIDNIPKGVDFVQFLDGQVAQCDVLLAVIGPAWLSVRNPETGARRLDDPNDFVRIEIASALKRGVPVVPVWLDETPVPAAGDLPEELRALTRRNGERLRHETFDSDVARLIRDLPETKPVKATKAPSSPSPNDWAIPRIVIPVLVVAAMGAVALANYLLNRTDPAQSSDVTRAPAVASSSPAPAGEVRPQGGEGAIPATPAPAPSGSAPIGASPPPPAAQGEDEAALAATKAGRPVSERSFRDRLKDGSQGPEMVWLPRGSFMMGSAPLEGIHAEQPKRAVSIGAEVAVSKYEATWTEYSHCVEAMACRTVRDDGFGRGSRPVTNVSWADARAYARWLSSETGKTYRLLSEAEWEYAARGVTSVNAPSNRYGFGDDESRLGEYSWSSGNSGGKTQPVGGKAANQFGLHDLHGNVWEWVEDCWASNYSAGQPNDGGAFIDCSDSAWRVYRGRSWSDPPLSHRSADRNGTAPGVWNETLGFRIARTP